MSLIPCSNCKQQISDKADICPNCGKSPSLHIPVRAWKFLQRHWCLCLAIASIFTLCLGIESAVGGVGFIGLLVATACGLIRLFLLLEKPQPRDKPASNRRTTESPSEKAGKGPTLADRFYSMESRVSLSSNLDFVVMPVSACVTIAVFWLFAPQSDSGRVMCLLGAFFIGHLIWSASTRVIFQCACGHHWIWFGVVLAMLVAQKREEALHARESPVARIISQQFSVREKTSQADDAPFWTRHWFLGLAAFAMIGKGIQFVQRAAIHSVQNPASHQDDTAGAMDEGDSGLKKPDAGGGVSEVESISADD